VIYALTILFVQGIAVYLRTLGCWVPGKRISRQKNGRVRRKWISTMSRNH